MMKRAGIMGALTIIAGIALGACATKDPTNPGTPIGTFNVTANLTKSTCGQPPNPWDFSVKLNHDDTTLYWITGGDPISGDVTTSASVSMTSSFTDMVRAADDTKKLAECDITRSDALTILLSDASAKPATDPGTTTTFLGTLQYVFSVPDGYSCSDQLTANGGGYDNLPCEVDYDVTGTLGSTSTN